MATDFKNDGPQEHPGIVLAMRFLQPLGIEGPALARALGVRRRRIAQLLQGRGRITPDLAQRLGLYFGVPARWWLDLQAVFDADDPERIARLRSVVRALPDRDRYFITPAGVQVLAQSSRPAKAQDLTLDPDFVERLRAQVAHNPPRQEREPVVVYLEDGRPMLTGRPA